MLCAVHVYTVLCIANGVSTCTRLQKVPKKSWSIDVCSIEFN